MASPTDWRPAFVGIRHTVPKEGKYMYLDVSLQRLRDGGIEVPELKEYQMNKLNKINFDLLDDKKFGFIDDRKYLELLKENIEKILCS